NEATRAATTPDLPLRAPAGKHRSRPCSRWRWVSNGNCWRRPASAESVSGRARRIATLRDCISIFSRWQTPWSFASARRGHRRVRSGSALRWRSFRPILPSFVRPSQHRERFGPFTYEQELPIENGDLHFFLPAAGFSEIPLPPMLVSLSCSKEFAMEGSFHFALGTYARSP